MSLGINLLPVNSKVCNFNCLYCECGLTPLIQPKITSVPSRIEFHDRLSNRLKEAALNDEKIDTITFAGNGEPTLHPDFPAIIDDVLELRSALAPGAKIAVLSNGTLISEQGVFNALLKVDMNILKLDSVNEDTQRFINCPADDFSLMDTIHFMKKFNGNLVIQTLFFRGVYKNRQVDNSLPEELNPWLEALKEIKPAFVMIYTIARDTPHRKIQKISEVELIEIAGKVEALGIETQVSA